MGKYIGKSMISGASRSDGPGEIAEIDLKVVLSVGSKIMWNSTCKSMISGVSRRDGPGGIAEMDRRVALSMGSKMCGNSFGNQ